MVSASFFVRIAYSPMLICLDTHAHTCTHTFRCTHSYSYPCTHIDSQIQTHTHTQTWTHMHTHIHIHSDTPTLICLDTHRHTHTDINIQGHTCTLTHTAFSPLHTQCYRHIQFLPPLCTCHNHSLLEYSVHIIFFCLGPSFFMSWTHAFPSSLGHLGASCHHSCCMCTCLFGDTHCAVLQLFHKGRDFCLLCSMLCPQSLGSTPGRCANILFKE